MPREYKNLVSDTTSTVGLDNFVLSGVVGFPGTQTFLDAHTDGVEVGYHVSSAGNVEFEVGRGIWTAGTSTLTRASIETSSAALNAKVVFSAGVKTVISTPVASDMAGMVPYVGAAANVDLGYYKIQASHFNDVLVVANVGMLALQIDLSGSGLAGVGVGTLYVQLESVGIGRYANPSLRSVAVGYEAGGYLGINQISIGHRAGYEETGTGAFILDAYGRRGVGEGGSAVRKAAGRERAILYGVMKDDPDSASQTLNTASAFSATYGMNIPLGQTYKIAGVPIGGGAISNIIAALTTIAADTTYAVASYLKINAALTVDGNLIITG